MIKLLVLDVDGCLTDGKVVYGNDELEIKSFNVKDGLGIDSWIKMGRKVAIISGRSSKVVEKRAKELNINYLYQGIRDKERVLREIMEIEKLDESQIAVIGDDLNDYKMLKITKNSYAPNDANLQIKEIVSVVLSKNGGDGAIREMIEDILKKEGKLSEFISIWQ